MGSRTTRSVFPRNTRQTITLGFGKSVGATNTNCRSVHGTVPAFTTPGSTLRASLNR